MKKLQKLAIASYVDEQRSEIKCKQVKLKVISKYKFVFWPQFSISWYNVAVRKDMDFHSIINFDHL